VALYYSCHVFWVSRVMFEAAIASAIAVMMGWMP